MSDHTENKRIVIPWAYNTVDLELCPFCESTPQTGYKVYVTDGVRCGNSGCPIEHTVISISDWQQRPLQDRLIHRIEALEDRTDTISGVLNV